MTEEIIIDGVNVAGCRFSELLYGAICCNKSGLHGACNNNPECEYKQLKRLEQENEELKKEKEKYKPFYELGAKCTQLNEVADSLNNLNSKYKSTLEEIKEIVIKATDISYSIEVNSMLYDIKDKINEVLYG